jgi:hypothetical protein
MDQCEHEPNRDSCKSYRRLNVRRAKHLKGQEHRQDHFGDRSGY